MIFRIIHGEVILSRDTDGCTPSNAYPLYLAGVFLGILGDYDPWPYTQKKGLYIHIYIWGFPIGVRWDRGTSNYPPILAGDQTSNKQPKFMGHFGW